jgi:hypothetical protein
MLIIQKVSSSNLEPVPAVLKRNNPRAHGVKRKTDIVLEKINTFRWKTDLTYKEKW